MGNKQKTLESWKRIQSEINADSDKFQIVNNAMDLGVSINYGRMKFLGNNSKRFDQGIEKLHKAKNLPLNASDKAS